MLIPGLFQFKNILVHGFTVLLTSFESKLTDYAISTDRLNVQWNRHFDHYLSKIAYIYVVLNLQTSIPLN